jgi:hypothetical protein
MPAPQPAWPTRPKGIYPGKLSDPALIRLRDALIDERVSEWYPVVQPPEQPPLDLATHPDYDHEAELAATPDSPTSAYRERALEYVEDIIAARDKVRPGGLEPVDDVPQGIERRTTRHWVWYTTTEEITDRNHARPQGAAHVTEHGKYLFFTPGDSSILEAIVFEEFQEHPFNSAKLPAVPNRREDAVLCLYDDDDRYKGLLRERYQNEPDNDNGYELASPYEPEEPVVRPRGFKTDSATRQNEYSDQYRNGGE